MEFEKGRIYNLRFTYDEPDRITSGGLVVSCTERTYCGEYQFIRKEMGKLYFYGYWSGHDVLLTKEEAERAILLYKDKELGIIEK